MNRYKEISMNLNDSLEEIARISSQLEENKQLIKNLDIMVDSLKNLNKKMFMKGFLIGVASLLGIELVLWVVFLFL